MTYRFNSFYNSWHFEAFFLLFVSMFNIFHSYPLRPGSYVSFLLCQMQFKQKMMGQIISLSVVSIAFDTAEMRAAYEPG